MQLPTTLTGIITFMVLVVYLVGITNTVDAPVSPLSQFNDKLHSSLNATASGDVLTVILNAPGTGFFFVTNIINFLTSFYAVSSQVPEPVVVMLIIFSIALIIAVLKWVRGVWDYGG